MYSGFNSNVFFLISTVAENSFYAVGKDFNSVYREKEKTVHFVSYYLLQSTVKLFMYKVTEFHGILKIFNKMYTINIKCLNRDFMDREVDGQFDHLENDTSIQNEFA